MNSKHLILVLFLVLILGNLFATFVDVIVKLLAADVSVYQYLFFRQAAVILLITFFWRRLPRASRAPANIKVYATRAVLANIGAPCAVMALLYMPLATANVIFYSAPLFSILIAYYLLNEKNKRYRIAIALIGFLGVIVSLRPEYISMAGLYALATALSVAGFNLSVRWLPKNSSTANTIFWSNILAFPLTGIIAALNWQPITQDLIILSLGACICVLVYQGSCIYAFQRAEAGAIVVAEYSGLIFAAALGWLVFQEMLDSWTIIGISLIVLPIIWQSWYEHKQESQHQIQLLLEQSFDKDSIEDT